jgi:putative transposase
MAHTYTSLYFHLIFSTKNRQPLLSPQFRPRLFDYMGGILRHMEGSSLLINGIEDHVHVLASLPSTLAIATCLRDLKGDSSRWVHETIGLPFGWQTGYAAFTVSQSALEDVRAYIANQEEHHRRTSFPEEYLKFLQRHGMEYDERFVLD